MKKIITIIPLLFILGGCTLPSFSPEEKQTPVSGSIIVDNNEYPMKSSNYRHNGGKIKINSVDDSTTLQIAAGFDNLIVEKNSKIDVVLEDNPELTVLEIYEDESEKEVTLTNNQITVPSKSGYYIYEIRAVWPKGKATFIFDIDVN